MPWFSLLFLSWLFHPTNVTGQPSVVSLGVEASLSPRRLRHVGDADCGLENGYGLPLTI